MNLEADIKYVENLSFVVANTLQEIKKFVRTYDSEPDSVLKFNVDCLAHQSNKLGRCVDAVLDQLKTELNKINPQEHGLEPIEPEISYIANIDGFIEE